MTTIILVPFPISQGSDALARQLTSVGMKRVTQPARANTGSPSLLEVDTIATSSSLDLSDLEGDIEGLHLTLVGTGSLATAFEGFAAGRVEMIAGLLRDLRKDFTCNLLDVDFSSSLELPLER